MTVNALVQTRIDASIKKRAAKVLDDMGLTVSDAVRILLTRTANEGALPFDPVRSSADHDAWFRAKVLEALKDPRPALDNEDVSAHFAQRRARSGRSAGAED